METDIPLKVLAETRAADLLPLLGVAGAHVLRVRSIELPTVVIVGKKTAAVDATALAKTSAKIRKT